MSLKSEAGVVLLAIGSWVLPPRPIPIEQRRDRLQCGRGGNAQRHGMGQSANAVKHVMLALDGDDHAWREIDAGGRRVAETQIWVGVIEQHLAGGIERAGLAD